MGFACWGILAAMATPDTEVHRVDQRHGGESERRTRVEIRVEDDRTGMDPVTLKPVETIVGPTLLAIGARVGSTRLIDNMIVEPTEPTKA